MVENESVELSLLVIYGFHRLSDLVYKGVFFLKRIECLVSKPLLSLGVRQLGRRRFVVADHATVVEDRLRGIIATLNSERDTVSLIKRLQYLADHCLYVDYSR